jgi:hypothetical protein
MTMSYCAFYFDTNHKLTNGCSQLSPSELREFLIDVGVTDIAKFNVERISWYATFFFAMPIIVTRSWLVLGLE